MERQVERYGYPSPTPPRKRKVDIFKIEDFTLIDNHAKKMPPKLLYGNYKEITKYLTKSYTSDIDKIRSLFVWVTTANVDKFQFCLGKLPERNSPLEALLRIHWKMGHYSHFFAQLCRTAYIPCVLISGLIKSKSYYPGKKVDRQDMEGTWNAVYCDGEWRLIDVHLATTMVNKKPPKPKDVNFCSLVTDFPNVNESYFLMDPNQLIYTHLPDDPDWQLLEDPITEKQFMQNVFLQGRYFEYGLQIVSPANYHHEYLLHTHTGLIHLEYNIPEDKAKGTHFHYVLINQSHKNDASHSDAFIDRYVFYQKGNNFIKYDIRLPALGKFRFNIYGKKVDAHEKPALCASYVLSNESKTTMPPFPDCPEIGWAPGEMAAKFGLKPKSHQDAVIESSDGKIEIHFEVKNLVSMTYQLKHNSLDMLELHRNVKVHMDSGELSITVRLEKKGEYALKIYTNNQDIDGKWHNVCNYLLRCHNDTKQKPFPRIHEGVLGVSRKIYAHRVQRPNPIIPGPAMIHTVTGKVNLQFELTESTPMELLAELHSIEFDNHALSNFVTANVNEQIHHFEISLPQSGEYAFNVYSRKIDCEKNRLLHVYSYFIMSVQTTCEHITPKTSEVQISLLYLTDKMADIQLPAGNLPRTSELLCNDSEHYDDHDTLVVYKRSRTGDNFRVVLPEIGEYNFDIFDENNNILSHCAQFHIVHGKPIHVTPPDIVAQDLEVAKEDKKLEAEHEKYRKNLRQSILIQDITALRNAINVFGDNNVRDDDDDLSKAKQMMKYLKIDHDLTTAMQDRSLHELEHCLKAAEESGLAEPLGLKLQMGHKIKDQLTKLDKLKRDALMLDDTSVNLLRNLSKPPDVVVNVIKAAFLILGFHERKVKNWKSIQGLLNTAVKDSLKRRIVEFKVEDLRMDTALKVKHSLKKYTIAEVREASKVCAVYFKWCKGVIDELEDRSSQKKLDTWGTVQVSQRVSKGRRILPLLGR